jgi:branched-chain amino acid transport system substrate-binding protein
MAVDHPTRRRFTTLALAAAFAAACGGSAPPEAPPAPEPPPAPATLLLGEYASLTGSEATFGQSTHNGAILAIEERNAAGGVLGKQAELRSYDDRGDTSEAGSAVNRLATVDQVVAILGGNGSSISLAGGRVAQQLGVPMVTPSSTNAAVTQIGDQVFRVCFVDTYQGYVAARFATDHLKGDLVATLYDQGQAYSKGLAEEFEAQFTRLGGKVGTSQSYTGGDADFSAQLNNIKAAQPDVIFVPGYYTDVANIAMQARKIGITAPLLGGDGWDSARLAAVAGEAVEGSYFISHYTADDPRPEVQAFVTKYQAKFGAPPDALAALGYDAARLTLDAIGRTPTGARTEIAAALAATKDFAGVTGNISMDAARNASKSAVIVQIKEGKPSYVIDISPPEVAALEGAAAPAGATPAEAAPGAAPAAAPAHP